MRLLSSLRFVRVSLALAVAFWMAGAGCLLGCENMATAAAATSIESPASSPIVASGAACASMHAHDCCAKRGAHSSAKVTAKAASDKQQLVEPSPAPMKNCPLAVNAAAALSKAGLDQSSVALAPSSAKASLSNSPEQATAFARPLRLPNRGHTYLRCCVFLI